MFLFMSGNIAWGTGKTAREPTLAPLWSLGTWGRSDTQDGMSLRRNSRYRAKSEKVSVARACLTLGNPREWNSSRKNTGMGSYSRLQISCIGGGFFTVWATREAYRAKRDVQISWSARNTILVKAKYLKILDFSMRISSLLSEWKKQRIRNFRLNSEQMMYGHLGRDRSWYSGTPAAPVLGRMWVRSRQGHSGS